MRDKRLNNLIDRLYQELEITDDPVKRKQLQEELLAYEDLRRQYRVDKAYVFDKVIQIVGMSIPVLCWMLALDRQMRLETGDRLMKYNSTRSVLNTPKIKL